MSGVRVGDVIGVVCHGRLPVVRLVSVGYGRGVGRGSYDGG